MAVDCAQEPLVVAGFKTVLPALAILGAVVAWIGKSLVSWIAWQIGRSIQRFDMMKALRAEIASNARSETVYADPDGAEALIRYLAADAGADQPWAPYVTVVERNVVFESLVGSLILLPAGVSERIVGYYNLTIGLTVQIKDFASETYRRLSRPRQQKVIRDLYKLGSEVRTASDLALRAIDLSLTRHRLVLGLSGALAALAALASIPLLALLMQKLAGIVRPAAEWASTCDILLKR